MKLIKKIFVIVTSLAVFSLFVGVNACSLINPNSKIVGKYELRLENPDGNKESGLGGFIGKTILKNALKSDVEFFMDGKADFDVDVLGIKLGNLDGNMKYSIKNGNLLTLQSENEDEVSFEMIATDTGFKLKNDDITLYLKKKEE